MAPDRAVRRLASRLSGEQLAIESLVRSLAVVVFGELMNQPAEMSLADRDDAMQALRFDGERESLREGVQVWALTGQADDLNARVLQQATELLRVERVAIEDEIVTSRQKPSTASVRFRASEAELPRTSKAYAGFFNDGSHAADLVGLTRFLDDPRVPLDNNAAERALRGPILGCKNHYGSRSVRGTEVAALYYSLLPSAVAVGMVPGARVRVAKIVPSVASGREPV